MSKASRNAIESDLGQIGLPFGVEATETSLIIPDSLENDQIEKLARQVQKIENAAQWWVADFIVFLQNAMTRGPVEARKAKRDLYDRVQKLWPEYSRATLVTWASIARRVPPDIRSAHLSFQHHIYVANLSQETQAKQIQAHFIKRAEETGATAEQTRLMIADTKRGHLHKPEPTPARAAPAPIERDEPEPELLGGTHGQFADEAQRSLARLRGWYESNAKKSKPENWPAERKAALIDDLRPVIVEMHKIADIFGLLTNAEQSGDFA